MNSNHKALLATVVFYLLIWLIGQVIWEKKPLTNKKDLLNGKTISITLQAPKKEMVQTEKRTTLKPKQDTLTSSFESQSVTQLKKIEEKEEDFEKQKTAEKTNKTDFIDSQLHTTNTQVDTSILQEISQNTLYPSISQILEKKIEKMLIYPPAARKRGIQGSITIQIRIDERGNLISQKITSNSGSNILDTEAKKLVEKLFPLKKEDGFNLLYAQNELPFTNNITISYILN